MQIISVVTATTFSISKQSLNSPRPLIAIQTQWTIQHCFGESALYRLSATNKAEKNHKPIGQLIVESLA